MMKNFDGWLNEFLLNLGVWAPILASILIVVEAVLAFLPLFVFVTVNILVLGSIAGGILSWILTVIGSFLAFLLFRKGFSKLFDKHINKGKVKKFMKLVDKLKFTQLVLIISIPFAPSFFINVGAGLSRINARKYLYSLLVGKVLTVMYCGILGTSLKEALTNPSALIKIVVLMGSAYLFSLIVSKKFKLDERFE